MTNKSQKAQQARCAAGRALLKGANRGTLYVEGRKVEVRLLRSGILVGVGSDKGLKLNPDSCMTE